MITDLEKTIVSASLAKMTWLGKSLKKPTQLANRKIAVARYYGLLLVLLFPVEIAAQQVLVIDVNVFGLNTNQTTAFELLDDTCTALANDTSPAAADLQETCLSINSLDQNDPADVAQLQEILDTFSPEEAFSLNDSIVYVSDYQTTNVYARINSLRNTSPSNSESVENNNFSVKPDSAFYKPAPSDSPRASGGGAGDGDLFSRLGVFFSGQLSQGEVDGSILEQDADTSSSSITLGTDYRFSDNVIAGAGFGIIQNETDFATVAGKTQSDGINLTLFGSWYEADKGYVDAVVDIGSNSYDLERGIGTDPDIRVLAKGSTDSTAVSFTASAGRQFNVGGWDLGGYFRISYTDASVDGYTERASNSGPGFGSVFSIGSQSVKSTKLVIGGEVSRAISTNNAVLLPAFRLEFESENEKNKENIEATLVSSQITGSYRGTDRDTSYTNIGIGGSAIFKNGKSAFAYYETHIQHDFVNQDWLKIGFRMEF